MRKRPHCLTVISPTNVKTKLWTVNLNQNVSQIAYKFSSQSHKSNATIVGKTRATACTRPKYNRDHWVTNGNARAELLLFAICFAGWNAQKCDVELFGFLIFVGFFVRRVLIAFLPGFDIATIKNWINRLHISNSNCICTIISKECLSNYWQEQNSKKCCFFVGLFPFENSHPMMWTRGGRLTNVTGWVVKCVRESS